MNHIKTFDDLINYYSNLEDKYIDIQTGINQEGGINLILLILAIIAIFSATTTAMTANITKTVVESSQSSQSSNSLYSLKDFYSAGIDTVTEFNSNNTNSSGLNQLVLSLDEESSQLTTRSSVEKIIASSSFAQNWSNQIFSLAVKPIRLEFNQNFLTTNMYVTKQLYGVLQLDPKSIVKDDAQGVVNYVQNQPKKSHQEIAGAEISERQVSTYVNELSEYIDFNSTVKEGITKLVKGNITKIQELHNMFLKGEVKIESIAFDSQNSFILIQYFLILKNLPNINSQQITYALLVCATSQVLVENQTPNIYDLVKSEVPEVITQAKFSIVKGLFSSGFTNKFIQDLPNIDSYSRSLFFNTHTYNPNTFEINLKQLPQINALVPISQKEIPVFEQPKSYPYEQPLLSAPIVYINDEYKSLLTNRLIKASNFFVKYHEKIKLTDFTKFLTDIAVNSQRIISNKEYDKDLVLVENIVIFYESLLDSLDKLSESFTRINTIIDSASKTAVLNENINKLKLVESELSPILRNILLLNVNLINPKSVEDANKTIIDIFNEHNNFIKKTNEVLRQLDNTSKIKKITQVTISTRHESVSLDPKKLQLDSLITLISIFEVLPEAIPDRVNSTVLAPITKNLTEALDKLNYENKTKTVEEEIKELNSYLSTNITKENFKDKIIIIAKDIFDKLSTYSSKALFTLSKPISLLASLATKINDKKILQKSGSLIFILTILYQILNTTLGNLDLRRITEAAIDIIRSNETINRFMIDLLTKITLGIGVGVGVSVGVGVGVGVAIGMKLNAQPTDVQKKYIDEFDKTKINEHPKQNEIYKKLSNRYNQYISSISNVKLSKNEIKNIKFKIAKMLELELNLFKHPSKEYTFAEAYDKFINN